jgi:hypothetical protein
MVVADYSTAQIMVERNEGGVHGRIGGRCGIFIMYVCGKGKGSCSQSGVEWSGVE